MSDDLEARAFHLAGHAIMSMSAGFEVEALCVHGFPGMGVAPKGYQRLDEGTLLRRLTDAPLWGTPRYCKLTEYLIWMAMAGPVAELRFRDQPCTVEAVQCDGSDWCQVERSAHWLMTDAKFIANYFKRYVSRVEKFFWPLEQSDRLLRLAHRLREAGRLEHDQIREAYELDEE